MAVGWVCSVSLFAYGFKVVQSTRVSSWSYWDQWQLAYTAVQLALGVRIPIRGRAPGDPPTSWEGNWLLLVMRVATVFTFVVSTARRAPTASTDLIARASCR